MCHRDILDKTKAVSDYFFSELYRPCPRGCLAVQIRKHKMMQINAWRLFKTNEDTFSMENLQSFPFLQEIESAKMIKGQRNPGQVGSSIFSQSHLSKL